MSDLESGLFLPIRFYNESTEQDRYKRHSIGVGLTELNYPYVDCTSLAPFQVSFPFGTLSSEIMLFARCADTEELIPLTLQSGDYHEIVTTEGEYYFSYLGAGAFTGLNNGLFYLTLVISIGAETYNFYSDLFMIKNCSDVPYETSDYRAYSNKAGEQLRAIDVTDLRIT